MELYHGSIERIEKPEILEKQRLLDFGKGFYVTSSQEQAERWAIIKQKRVTSPSKPIVNVYHTNDNLLNDPQFNSKVFHEANEEWLDFILLNRNNDEPHGYDLVFGPVANDALFRTLTLFESEILTKAETIARLKAHRLFDQISFNTPKAIRYLNYFRSYEL